MAWGKFSLYDIRYDIMCSCSCRRASVASETLTVVTLLKIGDVCLFVCIYVWTNVCHFVLRPSRFCVSYVVDPVPNFTKQNPLVYRSVPVSPRN